jgi:hypothetical protein
VRAIDGRALQRELGPELVAGIDGRQQIVEQVDGRIERRHAPPFDSRESRVDEPRARRDAGRRGHDVRERRDQMPSSPRGVVAHLGCGGERDLDDRDRRRIA